MIRPLPILPHPDSPKEHWDYYHQQCRSVQRENAIWGGLWSAVFVFGCLVAGWGAVVGSDVALKAILLLK